MRKLPRRYVRQMPKIYGNLQPRSRSFAGLFLVVKALVVAGILAGGVYLFFFSPVFQIREVQIEGAVLTSADRYRALVPVGTNIWRISKDEMVDEIFKDSLVVSAGIFRGIPRTIRIVIQEKEPAITWYSGDTITLIDDAGFGFTQFTGTTFPAPETEAAQHIGRVLRVVDTQALPVEPSKRVVSASFVKFVKEMQAQFEQHLQGVQIDHLEIVDTTYDVKVIATSGLQVYMSSVADAGVQVRNLTRLILQEDIPQTAKVDLRIDRWAYVQ